MKEAKYQSKCPKCGNVDILNEAETLKKVHCQCCYHHYDYDFKQEIFNTFRIPSEKLK